MVVVVVNVVVLEVVVDREVVVGMVVVVDVLTVFVLVVVDGIVVVTVFVVRLVLVTVVVVVIVPEQTPPTPASKISTGCPDVPESFTGAVSHVCPAWTVASIVKVHGPADEQAGCMPPQTI